MLEVKNKVIEAYQIGNRYFVRNEKGELKSLAEGSEMTQQEKEAYNYWYALRVGTLYELQEKDIIIKKLQDELNKITEKMKELQR